LPETSGVGEDGRRCTQKCFEDPRWGKAGDGSGSLSAPSVPSLPSGLNAEISPCPRVANPHLKEGARLVKLMMGDLLMVLHRGRDHSRGLLQLGLSLNPTLNSNNSAANRKSLRRYGHQQLTRGTDP